jgi:hypothetical protein
MYLYIQLNSCIIPLFLFPVPLSCILKTTIVIQPYIYHSCASISSNSIHHPSSALSPLLYCTTNPFIRPFPFENNDVDAYSLAFSLTVPIFRLPPYFFNTLSLWYFQNCFVASLPATRLRILEPPGCSSTKSVGVLISITFGGDDCWANWERDEGRQRELTQDCCGEQ